MLIEEIFKNIAFKRKIVHSGNGRLRINFPILKSVPKEWQYSEKYFEYFLGIEGIKSIDVNYITGNLLIIYDSSKITEEKILDIIDKILQVSKKNINELSKFFLAEKEEAYKFFITLLESLF